LLLLGIICAGFSPAYAQYILWQYPTFDVQLPPAVAPDGTVYVVSQGGSIEAVSIDGLKKWSVPLDAVPTTSPVIDSSGFIYLGLANGSVVSFTPDGSKRWSLPLGGEVIPPITLGPQNRLYAASDGMAHCISSDGKKLWSYNSNAKITGPPVPDGAGLVYLATDATGFVAISDADGSEKWVFPNVAGNGYRPWPTQAGIWFADDTGFIYLLSRDGKDLVTLEPAVNGGKWIGARIAAAPDGTLYAPAGDGKLHALAPDGKDKWTVSLPDGVSSTPFLASDGLVYLGSGSKLIGIAPGGEIKLEFSGKGTVSAVLRHDSGALFASFSRGGLSGSPGNLAMLTRVVPGEPPEPRWQQTGLTGIGVWKLAADPSAKGTAYAGTENGLFFTSDGGKTWVNTGLREPGPSGGVPSVRALDVSGDGTAYALAGESIATGHASSWDITVKMEEFDKIAVDPTNSQNLAVGSTKTGEVDLFSDGGYLVSGILEIAGLRDLLYGGKGTLYALTDAGLLRVPDGAVLRQGNFADLIVSEDENTLYLAGEPGLLVSTDGGKAWTQLGTNLPGMVFRVAVDPTNPQVIFAATAVRRDRPDPSAVDGIGVYRSSDGGTTWTLFNFGLSDLDVRDLAYVPDVGVMLANPRGVYSASTAVVPPGPTVKPGDIDGDGRLAITDVTLALRIAVGLKADATPAQIKAGDVAPKGTPDGKITIADVTRLLRRVVGLEPDPWP